MRRVIVIPILLFGACAGDSGPGDSEPCLLGHWTARRTAMGLFGARVVVVLDEDVPTAEDPRPMIEWATDVARSGHADADGVRDFMPREVELVWRTGSFGASLAEVVEPELSTTLFDDRILLVLITGGDLSAFQEREMESTAGSAACCARC